MSVGRSVISPSSFPVDSGKSSDDGCLNDSVSCLVVTVSLGSGIVLLFASEMGFDSLELLLST